MGKGSGGRMLVVVMTSSATSHGMHVARRGHLSGVGPSFCCEVHPSVVGSMDQRPSDLGAKCFFSLILAAQIHTFRKAPGLCLPRTYRLPHPLWPSASVLFFQTHHLPDLSHVGLAGTILREQTYVNVTIYTILPHDLCITDSSQPSHLFKGQRLL